MVPARPSRCLLHLVELMGGPCVTRTPVSFVLAEGGPLPGMQSMRPCVSRTGGSTSWSPWAARASRALPSAPRGLGGGGGPEEGTSESPARERGIAPTSPERKSATERATILRRGSRDTKGQRKYQKDFA